MPSVDRLVIDSGVVMKWFATTEPFADRALEIRRLFVTGLIELHAPSVLYHEVGVVLGKWGNKIRLKTPGAPYMTVAESRGVLTTLWNLGLHLADLTPESAAEAVEMAVGYSKGFKDMLFLQLARELDCRLITSDERMVEAVPKSFPRSQVVLLKDW